MARATSKGGHDSGVRLSAEETLRLESCHQLLARACIEIGIKAEGSSKLTRALEDVAQARDTLWSVTKRFPREYPINSAAIKEALAITHLDQLVFSAMGGAMTNWQFWRKEERERRESGED